MKQRSVAERLFIEELLESAQRTKLATKGLSLGSLIKFIRLQLGMSQKIVAERAGVPQSTVSRVEREEREVNLSTINKILHAIACDLLIVPLPQDPIDTIRRAQARKVAEKEIRYLKGTMNLEGQQPDSRFIAELMKREEEELLQESGARLWNDNF